MSNGLSGLSTLNTGTASIKRGVGRPRNATSAMSQARTLMRSNPETPRRDMVNRFVSDLGISKTVASSYYTILAKKD